MLRCASSFVIAAYAGVSLIPQDSRALPAAFLRSLPIIMTFKVFYGVVIFAFDEDVDPYYEKRETIRTPAFSARHQGYVLYWKIPGRGGRFTPDRQSIGGTS
jgi:hypothetical protein